MSGKINQVINVVGKYLTEVLIIVMRLTQTLGEWLIFDLLASYAPLLMSSFLMAIGVNSQGASFRDWLWFSFAMTIATLHESITWGYEARQFEPKGENGSRIKELCQGLPRIISGIFIVLTISCAVLLGVSDIPAESERVMVAFGKTFVIASVLFGLIIQFIRFAMKRDWMDSASQSPLPIVNDTHLARVRGYFAPGATATEIEDTILRLLERWRDGEEGAQ